MKFGVIIMSFFAACWWIYGSIASGHGSMPFLIIPVVALLFLIMSAVRHGAGIKRSAIEQKRIGRLIGLASGLEGFGIFLALNILNNTGHAQFFIPVAAIIVGLHFLPLAFWLPVRLYYLSAASLCLLGVVGFWVDDTAQRILFVSLGAASILWLTCLAALYSSRAKN
jgi:hypothetical protein